MKHNFKVGDEIIVVKPMESGGCYSRGSIGIIKNIDESCAPFKVKFYGNSSVMSLYLEEFKRYRPKDAWIPFDGEFIEHGKPDTLFLVQYKDGTSETVTVNNLLNASFSKDNIAAYQIITPYNPPREKIIYKNKKEMLTDLLSRGKLYLNKKGEEHIYFSEDGSHVIGYVDDTGREDVAQAVLDFLEWWV